MASEQEIPLFYLNKDIRFLYEIFDVVAPLWYYDCGWLGDLIVDIAVNSYNRFFFLLLSFEKQFRVESAVEEVWWIPFL